MMAPLAATATATVRPRASPIAQDMANHCAPAKIYKRPNAVESNARLARMVSVFMTTTEQPDIESASQSATK